jgi:hypothetical protein
MENKKQTQITDQNCDEFRKQLYQMCGTFDINKLKEQTVIAVDCQGHNYQMSYPSKTILALETMSNVLDFQIPKQQFYRFIDNRQYNKLVWPKVDVENCAVVFDYSPILKYRSIEEISSILNEVGKRYLPGTIVINLNLLYIDGTRLTDRFYDMARIKLDMYVVQEFEYHVEQKNLLIEFCRKIIL